MNIASGTFLALIVINNNLYSKAINKVNHMHENATN